GVTDQVGHHGGRHAPQRPLALARAVRLDAGGPQCLDERGDLPVDEDVVTSGGDGLVRVLTRVGVRRRVPEGGEPERGPDLPARARAPDPVSVVGAPKGISAPTTGRPSLLGEVSRSSGFMPKSVGGEGGAQRGKPSASMMSSATSFAETMS